MDRLEQDKKCCVCGGKVTGRSNKIFCSTKCKNQYTWETRRNTNKDSEHDMRMLYKNNEILKCVYQAGRGIQRIPLAYLEALGFEQKYRTATRVGEHGFEYSVFRYEYLLRNGYLVMRENPQAEAVSELLEKRYVYRFPNVHLN